MSIHGADGRLEPFISGLPWSARTIAAPTLTVVIIPPSQNQPRIFSAWSVCRASTTTTSSNGQNIEPTASKRISSSAQLPPTTGEYDPRRILGCRRAS